MRILPIAGLFISIGIIALASLALYTYLYFSPYTSTKERLLNYKDEGIVLSDRNDTPYYFVNNASDDEFTPLSQVSQNAAKAIIAAEDRTFYQHNGISMRGIVRSVILNIQSGSFAYGGSTLTQQLVKNTLLSPKKSLVRKIQEAVLATDLESKYTKNEILEMYVNSVYFGEGSIGISEASEMYFAKKAKDLTVAEAAYLAGMLKFPNLVSPYTGDRDLGMNLQKEVIGKMYEYNLISEEEKESAMREKLTFKRGIDPHQNEAPHFSLMVIDRLKELYGNDIVYEGLKVKTSLDLGLQKYTQEVVSENVSKNLANGVSNSSVVAMDPQTGEVLALVGSSNWYNEKYGKVNMAVSPRQPGSSFKPIVYALAMEQGIITPATVLRDVPKTFRLDPICRTGQNCTYKPVNYDRKYRGPVTVRRALANSLNVPAVEVMQRLGIETLLEKAPDFGITTLKDSEYYGAGLSLGLGSAEIPPLQMASAYSTFANNGQRPDPILILEIRDKFGKILYESSPSFHPVISDETAYLINSILSDNNARSEMFGSILTTPFPAAVKTGTTDNYRDAWTIGYTPSFVVAVWAGNNDGSPILNLPGSLAAAPIWKEIMNHKVSQQTTYEHFEKPLRIVQTRYCDPTSSGSARLEYFVKGTQTETNCRPRRSIPNEVARNDENLPHIGGAGIQQSSEEKEEDKDKNEEENDNNYAGSRREEERGQNRNNEREKERD